MRSSFALLALAAALVGAGGCAAARPPIPVVQHVDLPRFMGDWYVIACIPTFLEEGAHNAVESYRLDRDGTIATTFTYRDGSFEGPEKRYTPRGFVLDTTSNAVWGMRFVWPVKGDYRIVHLDDSYTRTIVGRDKRDYVWIMARTPSIPEPEYQDLLSRVREFGYDTDKVVRIPQSWPSR